MPSESRIVAPGPSERVVKDASGNLLVAPSDWELLPPGDAGLTRRVKASGPTWTVKEKKGRRSFSRGVWASSERIASIRRELTSERATETYAKRQQAAAARRDRRQTAYVEAFRKAVLAFLDFDPSYSSMAECLATAVTEHATPVGSGTVARTQRIPIERRAESAVIAWMRHQTTAYDDMPVKRVKGKRRELRRQLAEQSREILRAYRVGSASHTVQRKATPAGLGNCPLKRALETKHGE